VIVALVLCGLTLLSVRAVLCILLQKMKQQGRVLLRLEEIEARAGIAGPQQGLSVGSPFSPFNLPNLDGIEVSLDSYRGKRVLPVNCSAHCAPCRTTASQLSESLTRRPGSRLAPGPAAPFQEVEMKSLAVLKRVLLAMASVIAFLGVARPSAAAPFYFYYITAPPNWAQGNPQPLASFLALTDLAAGAPGQAEDYVSLSLLNGASGYAYDTFAGESLGIIGADVSVPTAQWVTPAAYYWTGGPAGGGALAFFNSFNPFTGVFYANMMIVDDPPCDPISCAALSTFESDLGSTSGTLTPTQITPNGDGSLPVTLPTDPFDEDASIAANPSGTNYFASGTQFFDTPEGPTAIYVLLGIFVVGADVFFRRRRVTTC
jgi:hypothetical protein